MGRKLDKFLLLMWKNWLLQYRRPLQTGVEIIAPVLFSILLVVIRSLVDPETHPPKTYEPFCPIPLPPFCDATTSQSTVTTNLSNYLQNFSLVYSPSENQVIDRSMNLFKLVFQNVTPYPNSDMLEAHFTGEGANTTFAGIQFDNSLYNKTVIPKNLMVSIRFPGELRTVTDLFGQNNWHTNILYPVYQTPGPRAADNDTGASPNYYNEGFLSLQLILMYAIAAGELGIENVDELLAKMGDILPPFIKMQRFPYSNWVEDPLLQALESFVGIIIMLSFVYTCINTVKVITTEKEKQLKEAMKIMGLPNWLHWTAWFIKTLIFLFISIVLIVILLKVSWYTHTTYSVFTYANPFVILLFLFFYICATITFCFAISVFFSKANTAATVAGLLWFISYAPYLFMQQQYDQLSLSTKLISSLGSNTAMAYGFQLLLMFEGTSEGMQWHTIWQPNTPDDDLTLGLIMVMLAIDAIIYLLIAIYVEAIFPGDYGVGQPWYFPFSYNYWFGRAKYVGVEDFSTPVKQGEFFEEDPDNLKAGVIIRNLRKTFGKKAAVRNLTLNMYENHTTVLLGHNGAGKTTTMSMLTGMLPPTDGTATVNGHDIRTNMEGVRESLGLCPQHNILFDDLTVKEHIYFFSKLKGLSKEQVAIEIDTYVELLELQDKADAKSSTLSGGMKRKLCVGMALCGNSKVVMLDEPTAGMDPSARRALWDLIQKQKDGRTMILTTHFMDEADLLGDRIAIMAGGELQCSGSSFFLKKKFGAGYHLIVDKSPQCNPNKVTDLLRKHIPDIEIHGNIGSELTYLLAENQASVFEEMLQDLEQSSKNLEIRSYGISLTTLEEVFMKVGADHGQEEVYNNDIMPQVTNNNKFQEWLNYAKSTVNCKLSASNPSDASVDLLNVPMLSGIALIKNQLLAMLMKKGLSTLRTWILLLIQNLIPVAFLIITIIVVRNMNNTGDLPKLQITLDSYGDPITLIQNGSSSDFYTNFYLDALENHSWSSVDNITQNMLDLTRTVPSTVRMKYIVGASFERTNTITTVTAWFNNNPYHSPPLTLALVLNAAYKQILGKEYSLTFYNEPLPFTASTKVQQLLQGNSMGFQLAFDISFGMAFVSSFYLLFYVRERVSKSKHLQFVSGVKVYVFWLTSFVCDLFQFLITICALLITLVAFQEDGFNTGPDIGRMFLALFCFGFGMIPMLYIASYLFDVPATGFTRMTLFSVFTGVAAFLVVQVLGTPSLELEYVADGLHWFFLLSPHYSLATAIRDLYTTFATNRMCNFFVENCEITFKLNASECWNMACHGSTEALADYCCTKEPNYFKWEAPGIGRNLIFTFGLGFVLMVLLLAIENKLFSKIIDKITDGYGKVPKENSDEDSDVLEEKEKIRSTTQEKLFDEYTVVLKDVTKYYKDVLAVNGICLGVKSYECFGLLGINGAGKTTTFKMMTGDIKITHGEAWVQDKSIRREMKQVQKLIGYCPQFDALLDDLTVQETLTIFALLRGIALKDCRDVALKLANDFDFCRHLNKQVNELSGGNRRKLSTAISLIGDPPVIYLDEPTTGMDPATKRYLWEVICKVRDSGKCVILTSHSMEECEALCTKLAIMVNGNFKCLGSAQHLKNRFAEGYTLTIKIKKNENADHNEIDRIEKFVEEKFPRAIQREKHQELLTYYIIDKTVSWSKMFGIMENGKQELNIEDYSLGQSSLEQVFLTFTKHQL